MNRTSPATRRSGSRRSAAAASPSAIWTGYASPGVIAATLLALLIWGYWPVVVQLLKEWQRDANYSVGALVPLAAVYLLWQERAALRACRVCPSWWGLGLILLAALGRLFGVLYLYESAERYALVLTVAGIVLLVAGRQVFHRVRWILLFLALMVPLPGRIHNLISGPLQSYATAGTVFVLELFGLTVSREGNVMVLNDSVPIAVAEACSGLRMLTAFVVVAAVMAYVVERPRWQRVVLLASAVPVAIVCNLARLTATAVLYLVSSSAVAERFFHDFAGISMMPLAVIILVGELWLMRRLVLADEVADGPSRGLSRA